MDDNSLPEDSAPAQQVVDVPSDRICTRGNPKQRMRDPREKDLSINWLVIISL